MTFVSDSLQKRPVKSASLDDVVRRLDAILNAVLRLPAREGKVLSMQHRVKILHDMGFRNSEIARILGRSQFYVGVVISDLRKAKSNAGKR